MFQSQAWKRPICFTLYIKVEIYLQKPKLLLFRDLRAAVPTNPMEWVSVHLMADTPKSKVWRTYKTGIMVSLSVTSSSLSFKLRQQSIYFHSQLKEVLIHNPINITNRLQKRLHYLKRPLSLNTITYGMKCWNQSHPRTNKILNDKSKTPYTS